MPSKHFHKSGSCPLSWIYNLIFLSPIFWDKCPSLSDTTSSCVCFHQAWVANFERPRMNANSLLASPTGLSPYLRFGCLSCRLFYFKLTDLYRKVRHCKHFKWSFPHCGSSTLSMLHWLYFGFTVKTKNSIWPLSAHCHFSLVSFISLCENVFPVWVVWEYHLMVPDLIYRWSKWIIHSSAALLQWLPLQVRCCKIRLQYKY